MDKKQIIAITIAFILSCSVVLLGRYPYKASLPAKLLGIEEVKKEPNQYYRVYLAGKSLGIIKSKQELDNYIDSKQEEIKNKYHVDKVYAPIDLIVTKEITYNEKLATVEEIYNKIVEINKDSSFTIDGYKIEIEGLEKKYEEDQSVKEAQDAVFYVLDKDLFETSLTKTITAFIDNDKYEAYINDTQKQLEENETGSIIENLYIKNKIKITKGRIPISDNIYTEEENLNKYLLFGTTAQQEKYIVKQGDTIETIANNNKLSINEFLIANTQFKSENSLLFPGQEVKLGLINPQFDLVEIEHAVYESTIQKETVYKNDATQYTGYEKVEEKGSDGVALVTEIREITNGEVTNTIQNYKVLVPSVNKVVIRGTRKKEIISSSQWGTDLPCPVEIGSWVWPTNAPYYISSPFSWRWGKHHDGIDITGPGYNSAIKAANNGIVVSSAYNSYNGNFIQVKHSDGHYTYYGHLASRRKQVGDIVMAGDIIGTMGQTGFATGVHLHFGLYVGNMNSGGYAINPYGNIY